ncbi:hypothetical protein LCGC14_0551600 [marine sediment metagenome]|uniref:Uncharacterized protein n=1 Tax=marine sediment metagenome TaxID=412755 RepID=A0A0F9UB35_9ZZZZ
MNLKNFLITLMSISLSEKSKKYVEKNKISKLFIDIKFFEETCTQIYEPFISIITNNDLKNWEKNEKVSMKNLTLYISDSFLKIFGKLDEYQLEIGGFLKKILILTNVEPIIKNICKTN